MNVKLWIFAVMFIGSFLAAGSFCAWIIYLPKISFNDDEQ